MRNSRLLFLGALILAPVLYAACSDDDTTPGTTPDAGTPTDSSTASDTSTTGDSGTDAADAGGIQRGPVTLDFDPTGNGDPISLVWSTKKNTLFIADNKNNQIWSWTDAKGFEKAVKLLDDPAVDDAGNTNLGQIVELSTGLLVVPRFGFGTQGNILFVDPTTGDAGAVPGVDPSRRRTALTADPANDQLWGGYFFSATAGTAVVTKDDLTNGETDYATGLMKPVGVLVQDGKLLVSDQNAGKIYKLPLDSTTTLTTPFADDMVFAVVPSCDALTSGPNGSVITGQFRPATDGGPLEVRQAFGDGGVTSLDAGVSKPQGVAYDKTNKRLFIADSNGSTLRTIKIIPLE